MALKYKQLELGLDMNPKRNKSERPRSKADFYETPQGLANATIKKLHSLNWIIPGNIYVVLDPGCGNGIWSMAYLNLIKPTNLSPFFYGVDINKPKHNAFIYHDLRIEDYLDTSINLLPFVKADLIIGNPPFSLMEEFVRRSLGLLENGGLVAFLGRLEFLGSQKRAKGLFAEYPPHAVWVSSRRPSFFSAQEGKRTTDLMEYAVFIWREGFKSIPPILDWLLWEYDD